jgi:hypothetical protein
VVDPEVRFEVWLPKAADWNGKFNGVGNGGLAGSISYGAMNTALSRNYATASTDTGHQGGNGSWALGRPELLVDFASRGIHVMTLDAKMIVQAYYDQAPSIRTLRVARAAAASTFRGAALPLGLQRRRRGCASQLSDTHVAR